MNKYELAIVINGKVDEETKAATLEKINGYCERYGATITNVDDWGKRRLAYEIDKINEGYYYFYKLESASEVPAQIEAQLRIMEPVLRFLFVREEA